MAKKRRRSRKKKNKNRRNIFLVIALAIIAFLTYWYYEEIQSFFFPNQHVKGNFSKLKLEGYSVYGIDVSQYQDKIDWKALKTEEKPDFVFIRACAGKNHKDTKFDYNWKQAEKQNLLRGAYHYYRPNENSTEQANFFIKTVKLEKGDLPPILDIEKYSRIQNLPKLKDGLLNWLQIVEEHYGVTPILYTYHNFYLNTFVHDKRFDKYPLWIAWYNTKKNPNKINKDWVFWQFTDRARVKGIKGDVDMNVFNGNLQDLDGLRLR